MSWILKDGDQSIAHDADLSRYEGKDIRPPFKGPWFSRCGEEIIDTPYSDSRKDCSVCRPPGEKPEYVKRETRKLPRCKCPTCGSEHIIGRDS